MRRLFVYSLACFETQRTLNLCRASPPPLPRPPGHGSAIHEWATPGMKTLPIHLMNEFLSCFKLSHFSFLFVLKMYG